MECEYLDFVAGIAVNNVGRCHPAVVQAVARQAERLIHTINLYYTENQVLLAEELTALTGMKRAYWCYAGRFLEKWRVQRPPACR